MILTPLLILAATVSQTEFKKWRSHHIEIEIGSEPISNNSSSILFSNSWRKQSLTMLQLGYVEQSWCAGITNFSSALEPQSNRFTIHSSSSQLAIL